MSWHRDERINRAFISLMDALCTWERNTGRGSKLLFIPNEPDEETIFLMDGKPVSLTKSVLISQLDVIKSKLQEAG